MTNGMLNPLQHNQLSYSFVHVGRCDAPTLPINVSLGKYKDKKLLTRYIQIHVDQARDSIGSNQYLMVTFYNYFKHGE